MVSHRYSNYGRLGADWHTGTYGARVDDWHIFGAIGDALPGHSVGGERYYHMLVLCYTSHLPATDQLARFAADPDQPGKSIADYDKRVINQRDGIAARQLSAHHRHHFWDDDCGLGALPASDAPLDRTHRCIARKSFHEERCSSSDRERFQEVLPGFEEVPMVWGPRYHQ